MNASEPSELVLLIVKITFLALLWAFVLVAVRAVRLDLFGPGRRQQRRDPSARVATPRAASRPVPPRPAPPVRHAAPSPALPTKIRITKGPKAGTEYTLDGTPVTIGRAHEAKLVLEEDVASAWHAKLFFRDGQWFIEDVGSTNGTYLDRTKVTSPMPVNIGAPIRIGKTVLELHP